MKKNKPFLIFWWKEKKIYFEMFKRKKFRKWKINHKRNNFMAVTGLKLIKKKWKNYNVMDLGESKSMMKKKN